MLILDACVSWYSTAIRRVCAGEAEGTAAVYGRSRSMEMSPFQWHKLRCDVA